MIKFICNNPEDFTRDYESIGGWGLLKKIHFGVSEPETALLGTIIKALEKSEKVADVTAVFEFIYSRQGSYGYISRESVWGQLKKIFRIENIKRTDDGEYIVEVGYVPEKKYTVEEMKKIAEGITDDFYTTISNKDSLNFELVRDLDYDYYKYRGRKNFDINGDMFMADLYFSRALNHDTLETPVLSEDEGNMSLGIIKKSIDGSETKVAGFFKKISSQKPGCKVASYILEKKYEKRWKCPDKLMDSEDALMAALEQEENYADLIGYDRISKLYNLLMNKSKNVKTDDSIGTRVNSTKDSDDMGNFGPYDRHLEMWNILEKFYEKISNKESDMQDFFTETDETELNSASGLKPRR